MTVTSQTKKVTTTGDSSATTFSFSPIVIFSSSDLEVVTTVIATGVETVRTEGTGTTNWSLSLTAFPATGSIVYPASGSAIDNTLTITIRRKLTLEQQTDLNNQGGYFPDTQEDQFDKLVMIDLQQQENLDRAFAFPISYTGGASVEVPAPVADAFLVWNSAGDALTTSSAVGGQFLGGDGTVSLPYYSFTSDPNSGLYRIGADNLGMSLGGSKVVDYTTAGIAVTGVVTSSGNMTIGGVALLASGSAAAPAYTFTGDTDTGIYRSGGNVLDFATAGTRQVSIDGNGNLVMRSGNIILADSGAAATPGYAFNGDPDTGIYNSSANVLDFVTSGTRQVTIDSAGQLIMLTGNAFLADPGSAAAAGIGFSGDQDMGLYRIGADNLGVTLGGTLRFDFSTGQLSAATAGAAALMNEAASDTNPSLVPDRSALSTGIGGGSTTVSFVVNGTNTLKSTATTLVSSNDLSFSQANPEILGGDTDGVLSITADTATNQGGNIKLYGNTHASKAQDIEFLADSTVVAHWDESANTWALTGDVTVDNGAGMVIGGTSQQTVGAEVSEFQILGTALADSTQTIGLWTSGSAVGPQLKLLKSRNATIGSSTIVQDNDELGMIVFYGDDGSDFATPGASIFARVNGAPGANDMPTELVFATTADGANSVTERLTISAAGVAAFTGEVTATGFTGTLDGVLGGGTPAAATVTTLGVNGDITSDADGTDSIGSTGTRFLKAWLDSVTVTGDVGAATGTFTGEVTATGFTGTLDGVLGGGTPAAATVTTLGVNGDITSDADGTDSIGSTGVRFLKAWLDSVTVTGDVGAATGTFTGEVTGTGFTGTLDGILGGGTPAAVTATTGTYSGAVGTGSLTVTGTITSTNTLNGPAGSAGFPTYTWTGDINTGMYRVAADSIGLATAGANALTIDAAGAITAPLQPAVNAYNSANDSGVSGNGTAATVDFDAEIFDQGGDFTGDTFTAPVTGKYLISCSLGISGVTATANIRASIRIVTSNRTYLNEHRNITALQVDPLHIMSSVVADMDASDTMTVQYVGSGESSDVHTILGNVNHWTRVSICLLA